jgi:hypothetical protein
MALKHGDKEINYVNVVVESEGHIIANEKCEGAVVVTINKTKTGTDYDVLNAMALTPKNIEAVLKGVVETLSYGVASHYIMPPHMFIEVITDAVAKGLHDGVHRYVEERKSQMEPLADRLEEMAKLIRNLHKMR